MIDFKEFTLGSICSRLSSGKGINASLINEQGKYPVYGGNGLRGFTELCNFSGECAIVGRQGAFCGNVRYFSGDAYMTEHAVVICANEQHNTRYLAYLLSTMNLGRLSGQSAQPGISVRTLSNQDVTLPPKEFQDKVASILARIEDKMAINENINDNLLQQAVALFRHFLPYSVEDQLPDGWQVGTVGDIVEIHDYKRIPLSGAQRAKMTKRTYPYYGAASLMDYVDEYIFDGKYLLLGEDGTVIDDSGYPILQYVWGQFWVNNHAHILTGQRGFTVESLLLLFKMTPVKSIVTGAVQPKISQANLKSIRVVIPPLQDMESFNLTIQPLFDQIRQNEDQNKVLAALRDSLLPKLMSGEIDVSSISI